MAAPARMHPQDARIPCPLCGSLIHPIAGRCKHCKADLAAGRPQSAAAHGALPALVVQAAPPPQAAYAPPTPVPYAPQGTPPVGVQLGVQLAAPRERESSQVLPPRPTGRMQVARGRSLWKSWPMIVIVVASLAIVAAVVLMVWPDKKADPSRNALEPPPAPIRMETERDRPLPPSATPGGPQGAVPPATPNDPWSNGNGAPDPGDIDSIDPPPAPDPYAGPTQPSTPALPSLGSLDPQKTLALANGITTHFCDRMKSCGNSDPALDMLCGLAKQQAGTTSPPTCDAANRCFAQIDAMDCSTGSLDDIGSIMKLGQSMQSCIEATKC